MSKNQSKKAIVCFGLHGERLDFSDIYKASDFFGRNTATLYSAIKKGSGVRKNGNKWYLDYALQDTWDFYE